MPLEEYRRKRDFGRTPEPAPSDVVQRSGRFTVQRHRATALHYDFRLEIDGVLVSWASRRDRRARPEGPSAGDAHRGPPIEYLDFEGVIPAKEYGGGDVIVWDWGTWEPEPASRRPARACAGARSSSSSTASASVAGTRSSAPTATTAASAGCC